MFWSDCAQNAPWGFSLLQQEQPLRIVTVRGPGNSGGHIMGRGCSRLLSQRGPHLPSYNCLLFCTRTAWPWLMSGQSSPLSLFFLPWGPLLHEDVPISCVRRRHLDFSPTSPERREEPCYAAAQGFWLCPLLVGYRSFCKRNGAPVGCGMPQAQRGQGQPVP